MSSLIDKIHGDLTIALKSRDEMKVNTLRFVISKVKNAQIAKGDELTDEEVASEINKDARRHKESIEAFKSAGRDELAEKEKAELGILTTYLPEEMSLREVEKLVDDAIAEADAKSASDMGRVMSIVMEKLKGRADGSAVSALVKSKLG